MSLRPCPKNVSALKKGIGKGLLPILLVGSFAVLGSQTTLIPQKATTYQANLYALPYSQHSRYPVDEAALKRSCYVATLQVSSTRLKRKMTELAARPTIGPGSRNLRVLCEVYRPTDTLRFAFATGNRFFCQHNCYLVSKADLAFLKSFLNESERDKYFPH